MKCNLCPERCDIQLGERGKCFVRINREEKIVIDDWGAITNIAIEPIEKKPIYHFKPNLKTLSIGGYFCNFSCDYCQNYTVSQRDCSNKVKHFLPQEIVDLAKEKEVDAVCMTYNEPTILFEYLIQLAKCCHQNNLYFILKTNGSLCNSYWKQVVKVCDAINIDFKGGIKDYKDICGVSYHFYYQILNNIEWAIKSDTHVEISVPVYPHVKGHEYWVGDLLKILDFNVPVHLLKVFPANKAMHWIATTDKTMFALKNIFKQKLKYVFISNLFNSKNKGIRDTYYKDILVVKREKLQSVVIRNDLANLIFKK